MCNNGEIMTRRHMMKDKNELIATTFTVFEKLPKEILSIIAEIVFFHSRRDAKNFLSTSKSLLDLLPASFWKRYFFHLFPGVRLLKEPSKKEEESTIFWRQLIQEAGNAYFGSKAIAPLFYGIYHNDVPKIEGELKAISREPDAFRYFYSSSTTRQLALHELSLAWLARVLNRREILKLFYNHFMTQKSKQHRAFLASLFNHIDELTALPVEDCNTFTDHTPTPLYTACEQGDLGALRVLILKKGININQGQLSEFGQTALYIACEQDHPDIVKLLLEQPDINVNPKCSLGETPLYIACFDGHVDIVNMLLEHPHIQIDPVHSLTDQTPLHIACKNGYFIIALALLLKGANLNAITRDKQTPLALAKSQGHQAIERLLTLFNTFYSLKDNNEKEMMLMEQFKALNVKTPAFFASSEQLGDSIKKESVRNSV